MKAVRSVNIFFPTHILFFSLLSLADCVYIESRRPNTPYFICSIQDFKLVSNFFFFTSCLSCFMYSCPHTDPGVQR